MFLEPPLALAAGFVLFSSERRDRLLAIAWMAFLLPALALTLSRGAYFAIAVLVAVAVISNRRRLWIAAGVAAAAVVAVPSVWPEPLSRVLLEAMRFGRAVVATRVGGSPELVEDGVTGLLVPPRDPDALAGAVVALLRDPARCARLGAAAANRTVTELDEGRLVTQLLDAYERVLARGPAMQRRPA